MDAELLEHEDVRGYLHWRVEMAVAQRMDDIAAEAGFRMKRDPVLTEAVRLLREASSQQHLFEMVDALPDAPQGPARR